MHYKNGREAKNGDKVVLITGYGSPAVGILYDAVVGNDTCNGKLAPIAPNDPCPNLADCLHFDDILKSLPVEVPDSSTTQEESAYTRITNAMGAVTLSREEGDKILAYVSGAIHG